MSGKCRPFCLGLNVLTLLLPETEYSSLFVQYHPADALATWVAARSSTDMILTAKNSQHKGMLRCEFGILQLNNIQDTIRIVNISVIIFKLIRHLMCKHIEKAIGFIIKFTFLIALNTRQPIRWYKTDILKRDVLLCNWLYDTVKFADKKAGLYWFNSLRQRENGCHWQTTYSNWNMFLWVQLTIRQYWLKKWFAADWRRVLIRL